MPRFWCDYCAVHLTHDSFKGRKQHMYGWKHRENVKAYYQQFVGENTPGFVPMMPLPGGAGLAKPAAGGAAGSSSMPGMIPGVTMLGGPRGMMPGMMPRGMMMPPPMFGRGPPGMMPPPGMFGRGPPGMPRPGGPGPGMYRGPPQQQQQPGGNK